MAMTDDEVAEALGTEKPVKAEPKSRLEGTLDDVHALDGRLSKLVESKRQPGESSEQASARLMRESPNIFAAHKKAKAAILAKNGHADAAVGGL